MDYLSVKQVAELKGCTERYIRKMIDIGRLEAHEHESPANNIKQYLIPVESLPETLKRKYLQRLKAQQPLAQPEKPSHIRRTYDALTEEERRQIELWKRIVEDWIAYREEFRRDGKNQTDADPLYIAKVKLEHKGLQISTDVLYRKYRAWRNGNFMELIDGRGGWNRGQTSIPEPTWNYFLTAYLDDRRLPVSQCYDISLQWTREFYPELVSGIPCERTFRRRIETLERPVVTMGREGEKAYTDRCGPYINRLYDELHANTYWVADNHTMDIVSQGEHGTQHRRSLTAFIDALSGVIVGWNLTDNPCSNSTVLALRHGILRHGIPDAAYFDNGSEFLTHDLAGRGHRSRKSQDLIKDPPPIFSRLGIELRNALVRNARAKPIERTFGTLKNSISRLFETFTGGDIEERPESLKYKLKKGIIPLDHQLDVLIGELIELYNAGQYGGVIAKHKGKSRMEVWNESIQTVVQRRADPDDLNLLLMRSTRPQKVGRGGVYITVSGEKLFYDSEDSTWLFGETVYVRYDPADLSKVLVYDADTDRRLCQMTASLSTYLLFNETDKTELQAAQAAIRSKRKADKMRLQEYLTQLPPEQRISALDIRIRQAHAAKEGMIIASGKVIRPVSSGEQTLEAAVGADVVTVPIDFKKMNENAKRHKTQIK